MSIEVAVSRIDQIVAAQQQLTLPAQATAAASTSGALVGPSSGAALNTTTFAQALAAAQSPSGGADAAGTVVPQAAWNPQQKPIAAWIAPILQWASERGWTGTVTSGYRTYDEQAAINASGAYSAPAGKSNHESATYPGGAVDVTEPGQLMSVLQGYTGPLKLMGGVLGPVDPEHFSATGH